MTTNIVTEQEMSEVVMLISGDEELMLDACDGKRTIVQATDVFSYIDPYFKKWDTDKAGRATPKMRVAVYEITKNAIFATMFGALAHDPRELVLEQDQILDFVQKYRGWLRKDGESTFFLFSADRHFFVANVRVYSSGRLEVNIRKFGYDFVWNAVSLHRLVIPKRQPLK